MVFVLATVGLWWHLAQLRRQMNAQHRASEQAEAYLGFLTHEVRNALQAVMGASVLMNELESENSATPEERRKLLDLMTRSSRSTMTLMDALMDRYRYTRGAIDIDPQDVDLADLLDQLVQDMQPMAHSKKLVLRARTSPAASGQWRVDPVRVQQVVRNLMVNAIKFTRRGGVEVCLDARQPTDESNEQTLYLSIKDTGEGLDERQLANAFRAFRSEGGDRPGTGLGLLLCKDLAEAMGGTISIESTPGVGSVFTLVFDASRPTQQQHARVVELSMGRVLIVDSSPVYGLLLRRAFEQQRVRVDLVESLAGLSEALRANGQQSHDMVLTDTCLADGSFVDVVETLDRCCPARPHVVLMRQSVSSDDNLEMERLGVPESVLKSSDVYSLVDRVEKMYQAAQSRRKKRGATVGVESSPASLPASAQAS